MSLIRKLLGLGASTSRVHMRVSVGEYAAGEQYDVPTQVADQWIARDYADGNYSREYEGHELAALRGNNQTVTV